MFLFKFIKEKLIKKSITRVNIFHKLGTLSKENRLLALVQLINEPTNILVYWGRHRAIKFLRTLYTGPCMLSKNRFAFLFVFFWLTYGQNMVHGFKVRVRYI